MHDGYEQRRRDLAELTSGCSVKPGQTGMLVAIGGGFRVLDRVSQPGVLGSLFEPLLQGYALDALGAPAVDPPSVEHARALLERLSASPILERDGIGLGRDVRLHGDGFTGAGVVCADELIQLSMFVRDGADTDAEPHGGRIRRPSRRGQ
jgi:hypothetical protein